MLILPATKYHTRNSTASFSISVILLILFWLQLNNLLYFFIKILTSIYYIVRGVWFVSIAVVFRDLLIDFLPTFLYSGDENVFMINIVI